MSLVHSSNPGATGVKAPPGTGYFAPEIETASRDALAALQLTRLQHTVANAFEHVSLHRERLL